MVDLKERNGSRANGASSVIKGPQLKDPASRSGLVTGDADPRLFPVDMNDHSMLCLSFELVERTPQHGLALRSRFVYFKSISCFSNVDPDRQEKRLDWKCFRTSICRTT
jgi:hypothetical protein